MLGDRVNQERSGAGQPGTTQIHAAAEPGWHVVRVKPQHERTVAYALQKKEFRCYVPFYKAARRWADGLKELEVPIFPGYVFCLMKAEEASCIVNLPAVYQLLGQGGEPSEIEEPQLHVIQRIEKSGLPISPWPYLKEGQRVTIQTGPLAGVVGLLASTSRSWHVVVNVHLLQRGVAVAVNEKQLALASAAGA